MCSAELRLYWRLDGGGEVEGGEAGEDDDVGEDERDCEDGVEVGC